PPPPPPAPPPPPPTPPAPPTQVRAVTIEGTVQKLAGECGAATFEIGNQVIYTTAATSFMRGPCRNLANGAKVEVSGFLMSDGRVRADVIRFD
ncbi:MAG: DUF5666 domain-containing protein, partial [Acidobacteriota bacterium]|nr:DUF5666 domain-containing protein [Acidobacteriota bacterium]